MPVDTAELNRITALDPMHIGSIVQHKDDGVYGIIVRGDGSLPEGCHYVYWYGNEEGDHWGLPYHAEYLIPVIPALLDELDDACHDLAAFYKGCAVCPKLSELDELRGALAAQEARDLAATERVGETPYGCDTSEHLADLLLQARALIAELEAALRRRTAERDASDNMLRNVGNALSGRVTMQGRTDAS
ncbi:MAG: hypothetical protein WC359_15520 [Dehalococcoidia bacterium]|jgi:hypothetical protein